MSSTLLVMGGNRTHNLYTKEEQKKDTGTCLGCKYQGTGSDNCKKCLRGFYKKYPNLKESEIKDYFCIR